MLHCIAGVILVVIGLIMSSGVKWSYKLYRALAY